MPEVADQLGRKVVLPHHPQRIVSLVPSQTELLYYLGLDERVAGITKFCVHPREWYRTKTRVGGTKSVKPDVIATLRPDLIIANKEENTKADIDALAGLYPVWISDIKTLSDALDMIQCIGALTDTASRAQQLADDISETFERLTEKKSSPKRAIYLIWKNPLMAAGHETFIHEMMRYAGFENVLAPEHGRYPELSIEDIEELNPEWLLLSSEPFPFKGHHTREIEGQFPFARVLEVDGQMFSWYGPRLLEGASYFKHLQTNISAAQ